MQARGFTLVELMIGLAILAILMLIAMPTMVEFMGNSRIRNTADSIAQGLKQAQVEALKRNRDIEFIVDPALEWRINDPTDGVVLQREPFVHPTTVSIDVNPPGTTTIVYSGLGQYRPSTDPAAPPAPGPAQWFVVTSPTMASPHPLRVIADPALGVGVRVCDPQFSSASVDPVQASIGCP